MKKIILSLSFIFVLFTSVSQTNCTSSGVDYTYYYNTNAFYKNIYNIRPTVKLSVNLVVIQDDAGNNNYDENDPSHIARLESILADVNWRYAHNTPPSDTVYDAAGNIVPFLPSTKIQFQLDSIYFYQDSSAHNNYEKALILHQNSNPDAMKSINVYVTYLSYSAGVTNVGSNSIGMNYRLMDTTTMSIADFDGGFANVLSHEFGHLLGLSHTYFSASANEISNQNHPDYLSDVFGLYPDSTHYFPHTSYWECKTDSNDYVQSCTNNIMGGTSNQFYFSPMQIYRMHKNLSLNPYVRQFVICEDYGNLEPIIVYNDDLIDFSIQLYNPLKLISGTDMTLTCEIIMPKNQKILIEPGARLTINGGKVTSKCGFWNGIELKGNPNLPQVAPFTSQFSLTQPVIITSRSAIIENADIAIKTYATDSAGTIIWNTFGGAFHLDSTTFRNNWRSIAVMKYDNFNPDSTSQILDNLSYVKRSNFSWDSNFVDVNWIPQTHFSLWGVKGIDILGCNFDNDIFTANQEINRLNGIYSIDASFYINLSTKNYGSTPNPNFVTAIPSFNNLNVGIQASSPSDISNILVRNSVFTNNHIGAYIKGADFSEFQLNTFNIGEGFVNNEGGQGIRIEGAGSVNIEENTFSHSGNTNGTGGTVGIYSFNSDLFGTTNSIYRNTFSNLQRSVQLSSGPWSIPSQGNPLTGNTMMQVDCNIFNDSAVYHNNYVSLYKYSGALGIQGQCILGNQEAPQVNLFQGDYDASQGHWQAASLGNAFEYHSYPFSDMGIDSTTWFNTTPFPQECFNPSTFIYDSVCPTSFPADDIIIVVPGGGLGLIASLQDEEENLNTNFLSSEEEQDLIALIQSSSSDYSKEITLMEKAPYLSEPVLLEMVSSSMPNYRKNTVLQVHYPVSDQVIFAMLNTTNTIAPYILRDALIHGAGVEESILIQFFKDDKQPNWAIAEVAEANSPLTDAEMLAILSRTNPLEPYRYWKCLQWNTPLSSEVMNALLALDPPTAQWVINKINQSTYIAGDPSLRYKKEQSPLQQLEGELSFVKAEKWKYMNQMIRYNLSNNDKESVVNLLETDLSIEASITKLPIVLSTNSAKFTDELVSLRSKADALFAIDPKSEKAKHIYGICDYYELMSGIQARSGSLLEIEEGEITTLEDYATSGFAISSKAKALLSFYGVNIPHYIMEPLKTFGASDKKSLEVEETISSEESLIKVYPNPSNGNFIVQGFLPENIETGIMNFRDLSGRIVKSVSLSGNNIRKVIFLENANGVYLYEVVCKTKIVARGKVIIQN